MTSAMGTTAAEPVGLDVVDVLGVRWSRGPAGWTVNGEDRPGVGWEWLVRWYGPLEVVE